MNRTMNGNHEMYTGGHTYFEMMLPKFNQKSSYFAMQNDNWVLIVLDTAYFQSFGGQEGNLDNAQMEWLSAIVQAAGHRQVVLFSHHQPFTQLDDNKGGNLLAQLKTYQLADKIFAWYWGHEHRCLLYDPHPTYGFHGRCVGHAAFPESRRTSVMRPSRRISRLAVAAVTGLSRRRTTQVTWFRFLEGGSMTTITSSFPASRRNSLLTASCASNSMATSWLSTCGHLSVRTFGLRS